MKAGFDVGVLSAPEVAVWLVVLGHHGLGVRPRTHDFLDFILGHLVFAQSHVVAEKTTTELISNDQGEGTSPSDTKDHIEGNA